MEPLIRLRLLGSQLNAAEMRKVINKIVHKFGNDMIMSLIFNHYLTKYQASGEHDDELLHMNDLISTILNARKTNKETNAQQKERAAIVINSMPSALIGECASYLKVRDYVNFSHCDRKIYSACYAPSRLVEVDDYSDDHQCNLNLFPSLITLSINVKKFNQYMRGYPNHKILHRLQCLEVRNYGKRRSHIRNFLKNKCFDFGNITTLKCVGFGNLYNQTQQFDFDSFIDFLSHFPNVTSLTLFKIDLSVFNRENEKISKLFPKLSALSSYNNLHGSSSASLLSETLLNLRSKQMVSITYQAKYLPKITFPMLKELLLIGYPRNGQKIKNVMPNIKKLHRISIECDSGRNQHLTHLIMKLFESSHNLEYVCLRSENTKAMKRVMQVMESAIFATKYVIKKSLILDLGLLCFESEQHQQRFVNLDVPRLVNALDASKIQNFMVLMRVSLEDDDGDMIDHFKGMKNMWKGSHLFRRSKGTFYDFQIVISNKDCAINGYSPRWILPFD